MTAVTAPDQSAVEQSTRRALGWGGGLLVLGLAAVGVGAPTEGGPIALAGLLATIYGIHRFGRLGPGQAAHDDDDARSAAVDARWVGGLALLAGLAFVVGGGSGSGAYAVMIGGGLALAWSSRASRGAPASNGDAAVATDEDERPKARRRRKRRKAS